MKEMKEAVGRRKKDGRYQQLGAVDSFAAL
jgi:hypothetical protein